ncbi:trehalose-phosphatase [Microlunatus sp. Gsoil 973]|uniref:trehalose-phosphatase n=1 Tax=Microlunatus sp. Gsoil 973 TaxID=2672569 RepID=UPI001E33CD97|nr:trehalose-phosphatase [Microlunatus sp. Gsoil 973]
MSEELPSGLVGDSGTLTDAGRDALQAIIANPSKTLVALDFDGTIAPIVPDPENARADSAAVDALARLGDLVLGIVVITGRPARTAVRLGGFDRHPGLHRMVVLGQYGAERWDADGDRFGAEPEPVAVTQVEAELPDLLAELDLSDARIEHKGRAIGVHTRELADPAGAFTALVPALGDLANKHGLKLEPGKFVLEIRADGSDKGDAVRNIVTETGAEQIIFIGDDLGDLPAFDAVRDLREQGTPGLLICSASHEEDSLLIHADLVTAGPAGVAHWLTALADALDGDAPAQA